MFILLAGQAGTAPVEIVKLALAVLAGVAAAFITTRLTVRDRRQERLEAREARDASAEATVTVAEIADQREMRLMLVSQQAAALARADAAEHRVDEVRSQQWADRERILHLEARLVDHETLAQDIANMRQNGSRLMDVISDLQERLRVCEARWREEESRRREAGHILSGPHEALADLHAPATEPTEG